MSYGAPPCTCGFGVDDVIEDPACPVHRDPDRERESLERELGKLDGILADQVRDAAP